MAREIIIEQDPDPTPRVGKDFYEKIQGLVNTQLNINPEVDDMEKTKTAIYMLARSENIRNFFVKGLSSDERERLGTVISNYWRYLLRSRSSR